jgi:iron complex outermembrane recepter protein
MASLRKQKLAVAISFCLTGGASIALRPALAQEQPQEPDDEIVVTGSFIERSADRPQPVTVLTNEDLRLEQRGSLAEVFKNLPQNVGSISTINTQQGGGAVNMGNSPTATINLRGLGARATLVLLNGGRQTTDGGFGYVDINNLAPSIMIERIELLTDGASALYGSDAVAGVANFLTRNTFEGIELRVETQKIEDSPANRPDMNLSAIFGSQGEQTSVVAGFDYATTEVMLVEDRYNDDRLRLGLTSPSGNPATFAPRIAATGVRAPTSQWRPDRLCGSQEIGGGLAAGELVTAPNPQCNLFNALGRDQQPDSKRLIGLSVLTHDFSDTVRATVEAGFARTRYEIPFGYVTPAGQGTNFPFIPIDNPGAAADIALNPAFGGPVPVTTPGAANGPISGYFFQGRVLSPAGDRINIHTTEQDTYRLAAKLDGQFGDGDSAWGWQLAFTDSWNDTRFTSVDTLLARANLSADGYGGPNCRYARAAEPGRTADPTGAQRGVVGGGSECLWWNPLANSLLANPGDVTYNNPSIFDWITGDRESNDSGELKTLDFVTTGDLWEMNGGTTGLAVGVHHREQFFSQEWDTVSKQTGQWAFNGGAALLDFSGSRETDAVFAELAMFPTETVEIQLAARYEDTGELDSSDPKVGVLWTPTERLFVRASAGTSFRQPGEIQMFGRGPGGATTDPVGGQAIQARGFVTGNPNLRPETSENWTMGVTWDATDRFTMELNYWDVTFEDIINQETASAIWLQDRADGFITDPRIVLADGAPNEVCEVTGRWSGTGPLPAGCLTGVNVVLFNTTYVNQAFQETSGIDYTFSYDWEALGSEWTARLLGSWTHAYDMMVGDQIIDGVGGYNAATFGSPNPEFRTNLMVDWARGSHRARVTWRHLSKLHLTPAETTPSSRLTEQKDFLTIDALYNYSLPNGRSDVSLSVTNLLDKDDPLRHGAQTTSTGGIYEVRGRVLRLGLNWAF